MKRKFKAISLASIVSFFILAVCFILLSIRSTSNCGGNTLASGYVNSIMLRILTQSEAKDDSQKKSYPIDAKKALNIPEVEKEMIRYFGLEVKSYWIKKSINKDDKKPIIICTQFFDNVPQPTLFNFYKKTPSFAAAFIDGGKLIKQTEYNEIDFSEYFYIHKNMYKNK